MKNFSIPISGLIATSLTVSSVSFAENKDTKKNPEKEISTKIYSGIKINQNENVERNQNTKNVITQTTKIVENKKPGSWWQDWLSLKLLAASVVGYTAFMWTSVGVAGEYKMATDVVTKWIGLPREIARVLTAVFGATGAVLFGLEGLYRITNS